MVHDWITAVTRTSGQWRGLAGWRAEQRAAAGPRPTRRSLGLYTLVALGVTAALVQSGWTAGPPVPAPPPTAAVGNWTAWTPVPGAGLSFLSPSLSADAAGDTLDLVSVGLNLGINHSRFSGGVWASPVPTGRLSFLPAVVVSDSGTPQLLTTGLDGAIQYGTFRNGTWSAPIPTGTQSFLPPAAALNRAGSVLELVSVGLDGGVRHSRFQGGAWSAPIPLNAISFLPPTLAAIPSGGLELAIIGLDRQLYHARFQGSAWSSFQPTGVFAELAPALAVSGDGLVHLAATGLDRNVVYSRFQNGAWSTPIFTGLQSGLSPVLAGSSGGTLELLARGLDRVLQHGRLVNGVWAAPRALGITTDARPALVAAGASVDAAVTGTDGRLYASRFVAAASTPSTPAVSFSRDIRTKIFQAYGCNGCHGGSGGLTLGSNAYNNIFNRASSERPGLARIKPGDPDNSYLFRKISGGPDIVGARMPLGGRAVVDADRELLRQWIAAGALNN
jgi:hypothetical protein